MAFIYDGPTMRPFVSSAPTSSGTPVNIRVSPITYNDTKFWEQQIQPEIRQTPDRLDSNWNWPQLVTWLALSEALRFRKLVGYVALIQSATGLSVPAGMVLLSVGYPSLANPSQPSVFVWYLATAPSNALTRLQVARKPALLEVLVDVGMVESEARGYGGEIGLHAANHLNSPASMALYSAYQSRCGLTALPPTVKLPGIRRNDGRYFTASPAVAANRMTALDYLR